MRRTNNDRGQAYTLEGFIGAIIVLMAVLFALQAVVITPTTGGAVDRSSQAQTQQEVQDALIVTENEGELSQLVRYWNASEDPEEQEFYRSNAPAETTAYTADRFSDEDVLEERSLLGNILEERFGERGQNYNVELVYQDSDGEAEDDLYLVYQGSPSSTAVTASYTVTLYEYQDFRTPDHSGSLENADEFNYPIPNEPTEDDGAIYNVVEVRVVVW
ncbi:DUF7288 family protein [Natrononativus amylolyticus]|uniref:DUF7288 family protein n=1 Tax=Natrononativus amylolyticus TaxID=2963434 RepID=UPI0020CF0630|nr:hypothetical protein [Natrononativus amylolyticus]